MKKANYFFILIILFVASLFSCPNNKEIEKITVTYRSYEGSSYKQDDRDDVYKGIKFKDITGKPQDPEDIRYAEKDYEFKGWTSASPRAEDVPMINQEIIDNDTPINEDTVFYAVYKDIQPFSIKFYKYNGSNYDYIETKDFTKKEKFKDIEKPEVSSFVKDGKKYVFKGWSETHQGSGFLNDTVIVKRDAKINKDTSLYAVYIENYLAFTADKDTEIAFNLVASLTASLDNPVLLQYKKDEDDDFMYYHWNGHTSIQTISSGGEGQKISLLEGEKIYFKGNNSTFSNTEAYFNFESSNEIKASGNIMYLVNNRTNIPNKGCFRYLFMNCVKLKTSPELPSGVLKDNCYEGMFSGCVLLTTTPTLYATTLAVGCYKEMFYACKLIETAPSLPAFTLATNCYQSMFSGCTALKNAPVLHATSLAESCYASMFANCKSIEIAPSLLATTLAVGCYQGMFLNCTSLKTAPSLPASTLEVACYYAMFSGCKELETAPALSATALADSCYYEMFSGCSSLTTALNLPATTLANNCYRSMFLDCTSLTQPPIIAATTLAPGCCFSMFYGCTKLQSSPILYATTLVSECYYQMFMGCSSLNSVTCYAESLTSNSTTMWLVYVSSSGDFNCKSATDWPSNSVSGIPTGWTRKNI